MFTDSGFNVMVAFAGFFVFGCSVQIVVRVWGVWVAG